MTARNTTTEYTEARQRALCLAFLMESEPGQVAPIFVGIPVSTNLWQQGHTLFPTEQTLPEAVTA